MVDRIDWALMAARKPVCSIGQLSPSDVKSLDAAVRKGDLVQRKAPFAGSFGAVKTYYAASDAAFDDYQAENVTKFGMLHALDQANAS